MLNFRIVSIIATPENAVKVIDDVYSKIAEVCSLHVHYSVFYHAVPLLFVEPKVAPNRKIYETSLNFWCHSVCTIIIKEAYIFLTLDGTDILINIQQIVNFTKMAQLKDGNIL